MKNLLLLIFSFIFIACSKDPANEYNEALIFQAKTDTFLSFNSFGNYQPLGVGGGGAMSGLSFSPYANLWFVGTDMGTVFRSTDFGKNWFPIDHAQIKFSPRIEDAVNIGFSANPNILYFAEGGINLFKSTDSGIHWSPLKITLSKDEKIKYFRGDSLHENIMYIGTNFHLLKTVDYGQSWKSIEEVKGDSVGTFIDYLKRGIFIYHATSKGIYRSIDNGESFSEFYVPDDQTIASFTAGRDVNGLTMAYIDHNGYMACGNIDQYKKDYNSDRMNGHYSHCGFVWVSKNAGPFNQTNQAGGDFIRMAENDSKNIYVTGSKFWIRQYGTKVWHSSDAGNSWSLVLHQYNWDTGVFTAWDENKLERSAIALDVGWDDDGYHSFDVNLRDSSVVGGTGLYFLFISRNFGENWNAPFTKYADEGKPEENKRWSSNGLEVTSVYKSRFHPTKSNLVFNGMADIAGTRSTDGGKTFTIIHSDFNSFYDFAFDRDQENIVYAAVGNQHDFPTDGWKSPTNISGAILISRDFGVTFERLSSKNSIFDRQFISIAFDQEAKILYAGTQGGGIVRSTDGGLNFEYINLGLPYGDKVISQIEVDPNNGDIYLLLTGNVYNNNNGRDFYNQPVTGIYKKARDENQWKLLRGIINRPAELEKAKVFKPWLFPTSFAMDFSNGSNRQTMYLTDYEHLGLFLHSGVWKSEDGGQTWNRILQFTHPFQILLDQKNPNNIFVTGFYETSGTWGNGGLFSSKDAGKTWKNNADVPYRYNAISTTLDPNDENSIFYTFFGSGMVHGPRP